MQINTTHIEVISCPNLGVQQLQQQKKKQQQQLQQQLKTNLEKTKNKDTQSHLHIDPQS
jgi:hypothetical protein